MFCDHQTDKVVTAEFELCCTGCGLVIDVDYRLRRFLPWKISDFATPDYTYSLRRAEMLELAHRCGIHASFADEAESVFSRLSSSIPHAVRKPAAALIAFKQLGVPNEIYMNKLYIPQHARKRCDKIVNDFSHVSPRHEEASLRVACEYYFMMLGVSSFKELNRLSSHVVRLRESVSARTKTIVACVYRQLHTNKSKLCTKRVCEILGDTTPSSVARLCGQIVKIERDHANIVKREMFAV